MGTVVEEESGYWARTIPIWIVATVIILIAVILISYPHYLHVPDMWYEFEDPKLEREYIEGDIYWKASFTVESVAVENDLTPWSEFQVHVFAEGDSPASSVSMQRPRDWSERRTGENISVGVEVWYIDRGGGGFHMNVGDVLVITGLSRKFEGGRVALVRSDGEIASEAMPLGFP